LAREVKAGKSSVKASSTKAKAASQASATAASPLAALPVELPPTGKSLPRPIVPTAPVQPIPPPPRGKAVPPVVGPPKPKEPASSKGMVEALSAASTETTADSTTHKYGPEARCANENWKGLSDKQVEANRLLGSAAKNILFVGGSRSGKTFLLVRAVCIRALKAAGSRHAIFRLHNNAIRQSIWLETLPKVLRLCFPGLKVQFKERDGYVLFPNGSEIWICGLDDKDRVDKILGKEFCTIYYNECSQIPFSSVQVSLTRLAQRIDGLINKVYYDLNPSGTFHYTYRLFIEHKQVDSLEPLSNPEDYAFMYINPYDNVENLADGYITGVLEKMPAAYRQRFLEGKYVTQLDGALWSLDTLEQSRISPTDIPDLVRIVIPIDPSGTAGEHDINSDAVGIGVVGVDENDSAYLLEDRTGKYSPERWARTAVELYHQYRADCIVAERNYGGDMVRATIHNVDPAVNVRLVTASRGKVVRAEPVAALHSLGKVFLAGHFPELESELCNFTTGGYKGDRSPNRADMFVWGVTELCSRSNVLGWSQLMNVAEQDMKNLREAVRNGSLPDPSSLPSYQLSSKFSVPAPSGSGEGEAVEQSPLNQLDSLLGLSPAASVLTGFAPTESTHPVMGSAPQPANQPANSSLIINRPAGPNGSCPACQGVSIARLSTGYRCNICGVQFGGNFSPLLSPNRADFMSGNF